MRLVVGDECGLIKVVSVEEGKVVGSVMGQQSRSNGIQRLTWSGMPESSTASLEAMQTSVTAATNAAVVQTWDLASRKPISSSSLLLEENEDSEEDDDDDDVGEGQVVTLKLLRNSGRWLVCDDAGTVRLLPLTEGEETTVSST